MRRRGTGQIREDPEWALAASIPPQERCGDGRIIARRHPTGWFITASHPPGLSPEERADFGHFVCVRVYLLLRHGPVPGTWAVAEGEWVAEWLQPVGSSAPFLAHDAGIVR